MIPDSVKSIGSGAFSECSGLNGELRISDNTISIGNKAFYNCKGLTGNLVIPDSVTSIGDSAFYQCSGLNGELRISDNTISIGEAVYGHGAITVEVSWVKEHMKMFLRLTELRQAQQQELFR